MWKCILQRHLAAKLKKIDGANYGILIPRSRKLKHTIFHENRSYNVGVKLIYYCTTATSGGEARYA